MATSPAYATLADLAHRTSWRSLAQRASPDDSRVTGDNLRAFIEDAQQPEDDQVLAALGRARTRLDKHLEDARHDIDSYLRAHVKLPLAQVPDVIRTRTVDLAVGALFGGDENSPESRAAATARAWLKDLVSGRVRIDFGGDHAVQPDPAAAKTFGSTGQWGRRARHAGF